MEDFKKDIIKDAGDELFLTKNIPLLSRFFAIVGLIKKNKIYYLKEDPELVQIYLPHDKIDTLIQWYNETIRFEENIPSAYNEGYIILENKFINKSHENYRKLIRYIAELTNSSFYDAKDKFVNNFLSMVFKTRIYFKFITNTKIHLEVTNCNDRDELMHIINCEVGETEDIEPIITNINADDFNECENKNEFYDKIISKFYLGIFATTMWYIATNTSNTKYIYTQTRPKYNYDKKRIVDPKNVKTISTTIYDLQKVKIIDIAKLNKRKEGWTYSHAFQVHGHYRHYKNGKVVFIDSFVKGQNKKLKGQKIIVNPKGE